MFVVFTCLLRYHLLACDGWTIEGQGLKAPFRGLEDQNHTPLVVESGPLRLWPDLQPIKHIKHFTFTLQDTT